MVLIEQLFGPSLHSILEVLLDRGRNKRKTGVRDVDVLMQEGAVIPLEFSVYFVVFLLLMTVEHMKYPQHLRTCAVVHIISHLGTKGGNRSLQCLHPHPKTCRM